MFFVLAYIHTQKRVTSSTSTFLICLTRYMSVPAWCAVSILLKVFLPTCTFLVWILCFCLPTFHSPLIWCGQQQCNTGSLSWIYHLSHVSTNLKSNTTTQHGINELSHFSQWFYFFIFFKWCKKDLRLHNYNKTGDISQIFTQTRQGICYCN